MGLHFPGEKSVWFLGGNFCSAIFPLINNPLFMFQRDKLRFRNVEKDTLLYINVILSWIQHVSFVLSLVKAIYLVLHTYSTHCIRTLWHRCVIHWMFAKLVEQSKDARTKETNIIILLRGIHQVAALLRQAVVHTIQLVQYVFTCSTNMFTLQGLL